MWAVLAASASMPLPDYRDALVQAAWYEVNGLIDAACVDRPVHLGCHPEPLAEAIEKATAFQAQVTRDARLEYLVGLAHRSGGDDQAAERSFRAAVELDVDRADAWHDLGELMLAQGRYDEANTAFEHVARLVDDGPRAWLGPWRLAEVAAHRKDPDAFEAHMRRALERGFTFRTIRGLPAWKGFLADPTMRPSVEKLITVYGTPDVLDSLR